MKKNYSKGTSLALIVLIYALAVVVGMLVYGWAKAKMPAIWAVLFADVVMTVVIWLIGVLYENVSVYDPYWSVIPPVFFTLAAIYTHCFTLPVVLLLIAVWCWGIRLTGNWARTFKGIAHEDWRYTKYRETQSSFLFQITNFFGLNLMPTLMVFACMLPGFGLFDGVDANGLTCVGFAMCLAATGIELMADVQSRGFRAAHPGEVCNIGLWKQGRHPNYFGEILMWWGVWVMYASTHGINWLVLAPIAMTCLFLFISIPMMERRQLATKPAYADYRKKTRLFI